MTTPQRPRAKVLIVDDEATVCDLVDRVLRDHGYETEIADGGSAALEKVKLRGPFDLLVTDVNMPGLSGDVLAAQVRRRDPATKVLYFTGYSDRLFDAKGSLMEDEAFVDKPASRVGLLQAVALLLTGRVDL
jgi:CheY-like chemotaxis protein